MKDICVQLFIRENGWIFTNVPYRGNLLNQISMLMKAVLSAKRYVLFPHVLTVISYVPKKGGYYTSSNKELSYNLYSYFFISLGV